MAAAGSKAPEAGAPEKKITAEMLLAALKRSDPNCHTSDFADGKTIVDGCFNLAAVADDLERGSAP